MNKEKVLKIIKDAVKPYAVECSRAGERKNSTLLYFKDRDEKGFLITIADEAPDESSLQSYKTKLHESVCQEILASYRRNQREEDDFGRKCSLADNRARVIAGYLAPALDELEGFVLTNIHGATEVEARRAIYCTVESLAYYTIAGLVELGNASSKETVFEGLCGELNALYDKKNRDYGDAFAKSLDKYGPTVLCIRLSDKLNRFKALAVDCREQAVDDESIFDTLKDFANYAILTLVELQLNPDGSNDNDGQRKLAEYEATGLLPDECEQLVKALRTGKLRYCTGRVLPVSDDTPTWFRELIKNLPEGKNSKSSMTDTRCFDCPEADWIDMYGKIVWGCDMSDCIQDPDINRCE